MLTEDQARLLWAHAGAWMLAATIVDPDYGISTLKARAGGKAWPDGSHPELSYSHTWTAGTKIIGHNFGEKDTPVVAVSFTEIRRWARQVSEAVKTELRLQFAAMADERNRAEKWCRCPYATEAPNPHSDPCKRYHPTDDEERQRRNVMAGLNERQAEWVLLALGLSDEAAAASEPEPLPYAEFVAAKARFDNTYGHQVEPGEVHPMLLPHQRDLVRWAVAGGRRAIFAAFGLGKTVMQIEVVRLSLAKHGGGKGLIVMPLGVRIEFAHDARMLGIETRFVRRTDEIDGDGIYLTNYESVRDGKLDPKAFTAVSLDEASVLRSYGSKTYQSFLELFDGVPYRYVATATPSPNRYKELIHYAGYLGVMDTGAALTRWFQRDSTKANNLTLYPHKEREFWLWLNTWAAFVQSPAELGHDTTGYDLPPLDVQWHEVDPPADEFDFERDGQGQLVRGVNLGLPQAAAEKRRSLGARLAKLTEIVTDHAEHGQGQIVIWCDLNDEQRAIEKALEDAGLSFSSVYGSLDPDEVERRLADWKHRDTYALIGKPVMLGQGMNLQQAHTCVYIGITHKFNDLIQSLHRIQRFGQTHPCTAHLIHSETEREVVRIIREKWAQHRELTSTMTDIIHEYGLDPEAISEALQRSIGCERIEASGEVWLFANNDCVPETESMADDSVDLIVTSIPFSNHYEYTPSYNDFGHTDDNEHFWQQMDYLTPQLLRILAPGRIYACHVKDRILFSNVTGAGVPTVSPFHAEALFHGRKHGFDYLGMITVVTDVVRENNQTYRLGWSEQCKDATKMGVGSPEYILLFHKPQSDRSKGYADTPVTKSKDDYTRARWQVDAHAFWRSSGNRHLTADELAELKPDALATLFTKYSLQDVYDYESHIRIGEQLDGRGALPATFMSLAPGSWSPDVWHDVNRMLTLNGEQKRRNVQMHVCPLQFDIVDRLITRFSSPGELVFDPFGGLGTVPLRAMKLGRRGRGVELNPGYYFDAVKYLQAEERKQDMPTLFDLEDAS
ncbi:DNA methyltransferase [Mycolicibacterium conceptionense]|uniref:DNA methyltransferase n=1 Tax=Mycolicibacterium conceptionense TaxID=451644 RepID=UPI000ABFD5E4|nr:DNA methyltransferase [Mycolicibacterium conceptionense]